MAQYKITATIKTEMKQPRRGEREALRYRLLSIMNSEGVSLLSPRQLLATCRSLRVRRVA
jgi:hypothetical protein